MDLRDFDVAGMASAIPTRLEVGRAALLERLRKPLTDSAAIQARIEEIRVIRRLLKPHATEVASLREKMAAVEPDCQSVATAAADTRHADYYNQLLWPADSFFSWLNENSWWNEASLFFRTVFLPGTSVIMPVMLLAAPLVIAFLTPAGKEAVEPLTVARYLSILQKSLQHAVPASLGKSRFGAKGGFPALAEQFVQIGAAIAMFVASSWNQISGALSLRRVATDMRARANSVLEMVAAVRSLAELMGVSCLSITNYKWDSLTGMTAFGAAWNRPEQVRLLLEDAGYLDMLAAIALCPRTTFPTLDLSGMSLELKDLYHPGLDAGVRVYNSIRMDANVTTSDISDNSSTNHVLLTGPNRGGKSTFLKAVGGAVLMVQTVGIVFARRARLPIFAVLVAALSPVDRLGELSLFEAEIEFAKQVRATIQATPGPVFLLMDEIFHGTNAHDGVEASQVFLDELYGAQNVFSIVSTHYMELPRRYGGLAQLLCMEASPDPTDSDRLLYTYRLTPGVNKYSSVREILRERGLLAAIPARGSPAQKTSASATE